MEQIQLFRCSKRIGRRGFNSRLLTGVCLLGFCLGGCDESTTQTSSPTPANTQSPGSQAAADTSYNYNTKISFAQGGNATRYQGPGWSHAEAEGTWTDGNSAKLSFALPASDKDIVFKATMSGFTKAPELPTQSVEVFINGAQVGHWEIAVKGLVQLLIPAQAVREGNLQLEFKLAKATSPASLGISSDQRQLGLRFYDLELVKP
jgi:hypothetical protein